MNKHNYYEIQSQLALPYLSTPNEILEGIFNILVTKFGLKKESKQSFVDLGSGDGKVVIYSGVNYKIKSIGIEINKDLVKESKNSVKHFNWIIRRYIKFKNQDLFSQNLERYDFIYIYPLPTMLKFLLHLFNNIKQGAVIISYKYPLSNMENHIEYLYMVKIKEENIFFYQKN